MLEISKDNFEAEVKQAATPVVVDFWAEWCGPCKALAPVFEELSKELSGKLAFAKCNIDEHNELAAENGVMSIPTLIVFSKGKEVDRIVGSMSAEQLREKLNAALEKA